MHPTSTNMDDTSSATTKTRSFVRSEVLNPLSATKTDEVDASNEIKISSFHAQILLSKEDLIAADHSRH